MRKAFLLFVIAAALAACSPPVPPGTAMLVNGRAEPVHLYNVLVAAAHHEVGAANGPTLTDAGLLAARQRGIEAGALQALAADALVQQLAADRHVTVSNAEVSAFVARLEESAGGAAGLNSYIAARGVSRADYLTFLRLRLLQRKLADADPNGFGARLDRMLRAATIEAFVGPCATRHDYPACAGGR